MTRRHSFLTALLAGTPAALAKAEAAKGDAEIAWTDSPLGSFAFRSRYDHGSGTAFSFLRTAAGKEEPALESNSAGRLDYRGSAISSAQRHSD